MIASPSQVLRSCSNHKQHCIWLWCCMSFPPTRASMVPFRLSKGRVNLGWTVRSAGSRSLLLQWIETGCPNISAPKVRGFGTTLIEQSLKADGGGTSIHYGADGITCDIVVPLPERVETFHSPAQPATADRLQQRRKAPRPSLKGRRVLVVEDEPLVAMDLAGNSQRRGLHRSWAGWDSRTVIGDC